MVALRFEANDNEWRKLYAASHPMIFMTRGFSSVSIIILEKNEMTATSQRNSVLWCYFMRSECILPMPFSSKHDVAGILDSLITFDSKNIEQIIFYIASRHASS